MPETKPSSAVRLPAEWEPHEAVWVAWPSHANLWEDALPAAREGFVGLCRAIADVSPKTRKPRGERLEVLVPNAARETEARAALDGLGARFHRIPFGDIWLRDTAPLFVQRGKRLEATRFAFNGWGGKYRLRHDADVSGRVAAASGKPEVAYPFVLEGGSIEQDGEGTILTSRQCLLNPNRNPKMDQAAIESALCDSLGAEKVLWVGDGLLNDHTDGHIDTIARYVAPGVVVIMEARGKNDPNREILKVLRRGLAALRDARGGKLEVVCVPSPGRVEDSEGRVMPASHVNFYISNTAVIVPVYGTKWDDAAVSEIGALFPGRTTTGVNARAILAGGGAFHCITQQQPARTRG